MRKTNWRIGVEGQGQSVNDITKKIWQHRGIEDPEDFLNPSSVHILPPSDLLNIDDAALLLLNHVIKKSNIMIYADTDTDGCTSAAILYHYLKNFDTGHVSTYINQGKDHGVKDYFQIPIDTDLIIVVDSINDTMQEYRKILNSGIDLIVLDHHIIPDTILPFQKEIHLVSSANHYDNPHLSGSGVTWKFCCHCDYISGYNYADDLVDLAATGIIADVCDVGLASMENRAICNIGFKHLVNTALSAIVSDLMTATDIGFSIAPLVNAANRMDSNELALSLFLQDRVSDAKAVLKELTKIKEKQKKIVNELFPEFDLQVAEQENSPCYFFKVDDRCHNLAGLLATKASDKYRRPCIVVHDTEQGYAGSMRADIRANFSEMINATGLASCAGHENAAGILIPHETYELFVTTICGILDDYVDVDAPVDIDLYIERMQVTPFLINKLKQMNRISGNGFAPVTVLIEGVKDYTVKKLSQGKHLCVNVPDMNFIQWNFNNWDDVDEQGILSAYGTIEESFFMGKRSTQMLMEDYLFSKRTKPISLW